MATQASDKFKFLLATKKIDAANDTFKIMLMALGFTFDRANHHAYANVSANELANGYGYTTGGATLANVAVSEDDANNKTSIKWTNANWTANGGNIGPTPGAIIYDTSEANNSLAGFIDFGGNQTQANGGVLTIANIEVDLG